MNKIVIVVLIFAGFASANQPRGLFTLRTVSFFFIETHVKLNECNFPFSLKLSRKMDFLWKVTVFKQVMDIFWRFSEFLILQIFKIRIKPKKK